MKGVYPSLLVFGDSLTQWGSKLSLKGWTIQLSEYYIRKCDIVNRGFSGYTSRHARHIVSYALTDEEISRACLIIIWFGANDSIMQDSDSVRHVSLEEYRMNLKFIIGTLQERANRLHNKDLELIVVTPPAVDEERRARFLSESKNPSSSCENLMVLSSDRSNKITRGYAEVCCQLARDFKIHCLSLFEKMISMKEYSDLLQEDGLHLSMEGNQFVFDQLLDLIRRDLPQMIAENLPFIYPLYTDIDSEHGAERLPDLLVNKSR